MSLHDAVKVARSALEMERARMELISSNLANARTT
ncbi:MAG TPA: flagellar basal body rod protein FlgC, partial [Acidobacteria bacterium]|nr:flagellar basal body rod protein FlgC [Acidobacteriota bacterium]